MSTSNRAHEVLHQVKAKIGDDALHSAFVCLGTAARYWRAYGTTSKAAKSMVATFEYRKEINADSFGTDKQTSEVFRGEMVKRGLFLAATKDGDDPPSPVLMMRKRKDAFDMRDFEDFRRFTFFSLDTTAKIADIGVGEQDTRLIEEQCGKWVVVMDMSDYKEGNSPPLSVTREVIRIFQNHFPERAKLVVILDAPLAFLVFWRVVCLFMESVTRRKFVFANRQEGRELLVQRFGETVVDCFDIDMKQGKDSTVQRLVDLGFLIDTNQ